MRVLTLLLSLCLSISVVACTSANGQEGVDIPIQNATDPQNDNLDNQGSPGFEGAPSITESEDQKNRITFGFTPDTQNTLSMQLLDKDINLDPFSDQDGFPVDTESGSNLVYETLIKWDPEKLTYVPGLAELIDVSEQTIEIELREEARWHDGRPVTLEQIEISLYWMSKYYASLSAAEGLIIDVTTQTGTDDRETISFSLIDQDNYHLSIALDLLCRAPILPTTLWSAGKDPLTITADELRTEALRQPMGTGQWKVLLNDSFQLVLERQKDDDDNKPSYLMLRKYQDAATRERAIANQEVDLLVGASSDIPDRMEYYPGRPVLAGIRSNTNRDLLNNPLILNLLQLSMDTARTGKSLDDKAASTIFWHYFGSPTLVNALRTRLSKPAYAETYLDNKEDIANELQGEIGGNGLLYLDGNQIPALELILPEGDTAAESACQIFSDLARGQGLVVELVMLPLESYTQLLNNDQYDLAYYQATDEHETPLSLAKSFQQQWGAVKADLEPAEQDIVIKLATAITVEEFTQAAEEAFRYSLTEMRFFPLGFRTINDNFLASDNWTNFSQYWSSHQDNRDITGIGATAVFDSIKVKN